MAISYIVFDLEWNQSPRGKVGKLPDLPSEIIEVGAVKLDENLETVSEFSRFVRPFIYKNLCARSQISRPGSFKKRARHLRR